MFSHAKNWIFFQPQYINYFAPVAVRYVAVPCGAVRRSASHGRRLDPR